MSMLSRRASCVQASSTLAINEYANALKAKGHDIINLSAGEPDFKTPDHICEAATRAIAAGMTRYTPVAGTAELRNAVAEKLQRENQLDYEPAEIIVSAGCKHSIMNAMLALLNPGDEAIVCGPYWTSYPEMLTLVGAQPVYIGTGMATKFKIGPDQLHDCISSNTRLIILNSPSNPTGQAYTASELQALAEIIMEHPQITVLSDDIYEHLLWEQPFANILNVCPELVDRTIICNGVSKAYAMTGWRIGYAAGPKEIIKGMINIQSQSTSGPCSIAQAAALEALSGDQQPVRSNTTIFKQRHDFIIDRLQQMPGVSCLPASGTFYLFPDFSEVISQIPDAVGTNSDLVLARKMIAEAGLAVVPGSVFGAPEFARISFAKDMESLQKAMDKLEQYLKSVMG